MGGVAAHALDHVFGVFLDLIRAGDLIEDPEPAARDAALIMPVREPAFRLLGLPFAGVTLVAGAVTFSDASRARYGTAPACSAH